MGAGPAPLPATTKQLNKAMPWRTKRNVFKQLLHRCYMFNPTCSAAHAEYWVKKLHMLWSFEACCYITFPLFGTHPVNCSYLTLGFTKHLRSWHSWHHVPVYQSHAFHCQSWTVGTKWAGGASGLRPKYSKSSTSCLHSVERFAAKNVLNFTKRCAQACECGHFH